MATINPILCLLHWQNRFDSFGNILAIVTNIADKSKKMKIIEYALTKKVNKPFPIMALCPPVFPNQRGWESIYSLKEKPYTYHNGGIWPVIAGFWINALVRTSHKRMAKQDLKNLAEALQSQDYKFSEYMHGKTGKPIGKQYQSWSAAGYIIAYKSVFTNHTLF